MKNDFIVHDTSSHKTSINNFMNLVYMIMFFGVFLTGIVAYLLSTNATVLNLMYANSGVWVLFLLQIGLVIILSAFVEKLSTSMATLLFIAYSALTGVTFSAFFVVYTSTSIASAFFVTAGMFAALSLYGYTTQRNLSSIGKFLFMALVGLILATLVNLFLHNGTLDWIITYAGVAIFAGLTAHHTQKIKEMSYHLSEENGKTYKNLAILGALQLYLDFINLFIMILKITDSRN